MYKVNVTISGVGGDEITANFTSNDVDQLKRTVSRFIDSFTPAAKPAPKAPQPRKEERSQDEEFMLYMEEEERREREERKRSEKRKDGKREDQRERERREEPGRRKSDSREKGDRPINNRLDSFSSYSHNGSDFPFGRSSSSFMHPNAPLGPPSYINIPPSEDFIAFTHSSPAFKDPNSSSFVPYDQRFGGDSSAATQNNENMYAPMDMDVS